jgi:CMP/dCMP kinase
MPVITISRQYGSGGNAIAGLISSNFGYAVIDKNILNLAAIEAGLTAHEIMDMSEDSYSMHTLFDHLLGRTHLVSHIRVLKQDAEGASVTQTLALSEAQALSLVRNAIATAYVKDNFVIVGRGGQALLKNLPDVLHVRIEAPLEERIQRVENSTEVVSNALGNPAAARKAAQNIIKTRDFASAEYVKNYYHVDWADPNLYHLVINTSKLSFDLAARLIAEAARLLKAEVSPGEVSLTEKA